MNLTKREQHILNRASQILEARASEYNSKIHVEDPETSRDLFRYRLAGREHEVFCVAFLDNHHRLLAVEEVFRGTINAAAVYPREIAKQALHHNAAAAILGHNHPSGNPEPSQADKQLTERLVQALNLVDVRILDHIVVGGNKTVSFAERGYL